MKKLNDDFDILIGKLHYAYKMYCLNKELSGKSKKLPGIPAFWFLIKQSLMASFLVEVAKIFEKQKEESLTIYYVTDIKFRNHQKTIDNLRIFRNKWLVHNDLAFLYNLDKKLKELKLTPEKVADLCKRTYEVLEEIKVNYRINSLGDMTSRDAEEEAKAMIGKLLSETSKHQVQK
ncbi:MAG: hypothetical protein PHQ71_06960 [Candidatus Hydrothermia bacterium]|nr:hypothetical protein [Candidatus Hydrothermia bacterium]